MRPLRSLPFSSVSSFSPSSFSLNRWLFSAEKPKTTARNPLPRSSSSSSSQFIITTASSSRTTAATLSADIGAPRIYIRSQKKASHLSTAVSEVSLVLTASSPTCLSSTKPSLSSTQLYAKGAHRALRCCSVLRQGLSEDDRTSQNEGGTETLSPNFDTTGSAHLDGEDVNEKLVTTPSLDEESTEVVLYHNDIAEGQLKRNDEKFFRNPDEIVAELNRHIVGQEEAKKSLAIALRDRWRRQQVLDSELQKEITPNNILLIGPSGCGKSELAKRLAAFAWAPFVKVVATKYTEVGFVGDDTQSMVQDLADQALADEKEQLRKEVANEAQLRARKTLAKAVLEESGMSEVSEASVLESLKAENLDDVEVELDVSLLTSREDHDPSGNPLTEMLNSISGGGGRKGSGMPVGIPVGVSVQALPGTDLSNIMELLGGKSKGGGAGSKKTTKRKLKVKEARPLLEEHYTSEMVSNENVGELARQSAEQKGIIFIDEFDKLIDTKEGSEFRSKKRGVQKELLTLMEGTTVSTKLGRLCTDHILFVASGAFTSSKPTDIMPELQGRLPIRCELKPLTKTDFVKILKDTKYNLLMQQKALLATENVDLTFTDDAIDEIARIAHELNTVTANVGARRLKTVISKILEEIKFEAHRRPDSAMVVDKLMVQDRLAPLQKQADLSKYII